jgi:hypothetical protein
MYVQVRKLAKQCISHEVAGCYNRIDLRNCFTEAWEVPPKLMRSMRNNRATEAILLRTMEFSELKKIVLLAEEPIVMGRVEIKVISMLGEDTVSEQ